MRVHLFDVVGAADAVAGFIEGRTEEDYAEDLMLRSAVERQFEIIGEALARAMRADPSLPERLPSARGAIDFRNVIAHGYDRLADEQVLDIALHALPALAAEAAAELARRA